VCELLLSGDDGPLIDYENKLGSKAKLAVPTPDHYLPLLYLIGTRTASKPVTFPVEGVGGGSISSARISWPRWRSPKCKFAEQLSRNLLQGRVRFLFSYYGFSQERGKTDVSPFSDQERSPFASCQPAAVNTFALLDSAARIWAASDLATTEHTNALKNRGLPNPECTDVHMLSPPTKMSSIYLH
jgi:hypothetical protein